MNRRNFLKGAAVVPIAAVAAGAATVAGVQPNPVGPFRIENDEGGFFEISHSDGSWHIKTSEMYAMERKHANLQRMDAMTINPPQEVGQQLFVRNDEPSELHFGGVSGISL